MKKLRVMSTVMILGLLIFMYGCGQKEEEEPTKEAVKEEQQNGEDEKEVQKEDNQSDKDNAEVSESQENTVTIKKIKIYFVDPDTAEIVSKEVESDNVTPEAVWENLKGAGILTAECKLNSANVQAEEKKIDIDVNAGFGNYVRSMGTAGETEIIECVTRSYLETYGYTGIKITEDGKVLETGHTVLDGYIGNGQ